MLSFDPCKVRFENVKLKRVTTALGGSVSVLDEAHFAKTGKEKFTRIDIPMAVARMFKVKHKVTQFMMPFEGVLMYYDDKVVAIEKAIENLREKPGIDGVVRRWVSNCERHFNAVTDQYISDKQQWYFDGIYAYRFPVDQPSSIAAGVYLDDNGSFRSIEVQAVQLANLPFDAPKLENRTCVAFVADKTNFAISAPIWKTLDPKARISKSKGEDGDNETIISSFKGADNQIAVNVNFALFAAKQIAEQFGYEAIQPLQLPKLMVQLKTVNMPRLPKEVKQTTDIGLKLTHALAWLLGLQKIARTSEQFYAIRQMVKYLMTKGYYWKEKTTKARIFAAPNVNVPLMHLSAVTGTSSLSSPVSTSDRSRVDFS